MEENFFEPCCAVPSKLVCLIKPQPPWMTSHIRSTIKAKHSAWRAFKLRPSSATKSSFVLLRNKVTSFLRSAERSYLTTLQRDIWLTNSLCSVRLFWRRLKSLSGRIKTSAIPDLNIPSDKGDPPRVATADIDKAKIFNDFFASQTFLDSCPPSVPDLPRQVPSDIKFGHLHTTPSDVYDVLTHLKPGKAPGMDELPPRLLSECAQVVSESLSKLYNRSFVECQWLQEWKMHW